MRLCHFHYQQGDDHPLSKSCNRSLPTWHAPDPAITKLVKSTDVDDKISVFAEVDLNLQIILIIHTMNHLVMMILMIWIWRRWWWWRYFGISVWNIPLKRCIWLRCWEKGKAEVTSALANGWPGVPESCDISDPSIGSLTGSVFPDDWDDDRWCEEADISHRWDTGSKVCA